LEARHASDAATWRAAGLTPDGQTLGTPVAVLVRNKDQRSNDYSEMSVRLLGDT
jgi:chorismate synthase